MSKALFVLEGICLLLLVGATGCGEITYHPNGWDEGVQHGRATMAQDEDCTLCHGGQLRGGPAEVGCQSCHGEDWDEDCTWCHGDTAQEGGAPPRGLEGELDGLIGEIHTEHLFRNATSKVRCEDCHKVPENAWSKGHMFDGTPGVAEVSFNDLNPEGRYEGAGLCSSLHCHGNGRQPANIAFQEGRELDCQSCHPRRRLSGEHREHLGEGVDCEDCHGEVVIDRDEIKDISLHIDGEIHLRFPSGFRYEQKRCSGRCHGEGHNNERW